MNSTNQPEAEKGKRTFLKIGLLTAGVAVLAGMLPKRIFGKKSDQVKMLTPDGKLVMVDRKVIEAAKSQQVQTNADVRKWMDAHKK